jgi:oligopeptide transport system substrate-binding protein
MSRKFMWAISLLVLASMILAACAPAATPTAAPEPTKAPAAAEPTKAPEATATTAPEPTKAPEPTATEAPKETPTLRINIGTSPDMVDPQKSSFVNEIAHLKLAYEGLTRLNEKLETVPAAAESWQYNSDATQLLFTLRKDLKYSDGSVLNAKRFEFSILRNIDPATAGEYASITDDILGAADWRGADLAKATPEELAALKAKVGVVALDMSGNPCTGYDQVDCLNLKITTAKPAPYFHTVMSLWVTYPAKEELITAGGETWSLDSANQIGNGPMIWTEFKAGDVSNFTPNPNYWGGVAKVNIEYKYITDGAVAFEAYKNDEFDIVGLGAEDLATVKADDVLSKEAQIYPGSCTFGLFMHNLKAPFDDKAVREAFIYALDRDGWVKDVLKGLGAPTLTWIPKGFPGYDASETRYAFDAAKAKQTLTDAGYKVDGGKLIGKDGKAVDLTLTYSDTPRNKTRNEWLANNYKTNLGVEFKLNPVESTAYTALTKDVKTAPQTFILGWCADYPDPQNWLSVYWMTGAFGERIGFGDKDLDAKMQSADKELDPAKRMALYAEAQKDLIGMAPGAFFWNNVNTYLVKPWVKGAAQTPQDSDWPGSINPLTITIEK